VTWRDKTSSLEVNFYAGGPAKSRIEVEHSKLADAKAAASMKRYWGAALDRLKKGLEA
jgi:hypothetical protein